jgi:hypothetical protein
MANEKKYDPILAICGLGGGHMEATIQGKRALLSVVNGDRVSLNVEGTVPADSAPATFRLVEGVRTLSVVSTVEAFVAPYEENVGTPAAGAVHGERFHLQAGVRRELPWGTNTIAVQAVGAVAGKVYAEGRL